MGVLKQITFDITKTTGKEKFSVKISVSKEDGRFTTYLPNDIIDLFLEANIDMAYGRALKPGYYISTTFDGLKKQISDDIKKYESLELIEEKIILKYIIQTRCSYCMNGKEFVPNGGLVKNGKYKWIEGTVQVNATHNSPFGFLIYVAPFVKYKYKRHDGYEVIKYQSIRFNSLSEEDEKNKPYLHWLSEIPCIMQPEDEEPQEIDYTEDVAKFFVEIIKNIFKMNEKIKDFLKPESIKMLVENKTKLLDMTK